MCSLPQAAHLEVATVILCVCERGGGEGGGKGGWEGVLSADVSSMCSGRTAGRITAGSAVRVN